MNPQRIIPTLLLASLLAVPLVPLTAGHGTHDEVFCIETRNTLGYPNECIITHQTTESVNVVYWRGLTTLLCIIDPPGCPTIYEPIIHSTADLYHIGTESATINLLRWYARPIFELFDCASEVCNPADAALADWDRDGRIDGITLQFFQSGVWIMVPFNCEFDLQIGGQKPVCYLT